MSGCPENPTSTNCGLTALKRLVLDGQVGIDYLGGGGVIVSQAGNDALEVLDFGKVRFEETMDVVDAKCLDCGLALEMFGLFGNFSVRTVDIEPPIE